MNIGLPAPFKAFVRACACRAVRGRGRGRLLGGWGVLSRSLCVALFLLGLAPAQAQTRSPLIAAASDLKYALDEVLAQYRADTGRTMRVSYGSSGQFFMQIRQGAPFELFFSADEALVFQLADLGLTQGRGALYGVGKLVLFAPAGSPLLLDADLAGLKAQLAQGGLRKFAIANPAHAPYGAAAQQALQRLGVWPAVQPHLVLGESASQAAQFSASGAAQGGLLPLSLALSPALQGRGRHVLVRESLYEPLRQRMVLTRQASDQAQAFYAYLQQPAARAVLLRYGFAQP